MAVKHYYALLYRCHGVPSLFCHTVSAIYYTRFPDVTCPSFFFCNLPRVVLSRETMCCDLLTGFLKLPNIDTSMPSPGWLVVVMTGFSWPWNITHCYLWVRQMLFPLYKWPRHHKPWTFFVLLGMHVQLIVATTVFRALFSHMLSATSGSPTTLARSSRPLSYSHEKKVFRAAYWLYLKRPKTSMPSPDCWLSRLVVLLSIGWCATGTPQSCIIPTAASRWWCGIYATAIELAEISVAVVGDRRVEGYCYEYSCSRKDLLL